MTLPDGEAEQNTGGGGEPATQQPAGEPEQASGQAPGKEPGEDIGGRPGAASAADEPQEAGKGEPDSPKQTLAKALAEVEKLRDSWQRAEAEMQNMRRRTTRDIENAHKYALEQFLKSLLPVFDSLEKATEKAAEAAGQAEPGAGDANAEGVGLCYKLLVDVLEREGVEIVDPVGQPFDPKEHEAMSMVENPDMEPGSVSAVVQKGFKLNGRVIRAAMVMVTRAPGG